MQNLELEQAGTACSRGCGLDGLKVLCGHLVSLAGGSPQQRKGYLQHSSKSAHCFTISIKITVLSWFFPGEAPQGLW